MDELEKLKIENEDLKSKIIDLSFEINYNKQIELIEFLREIYDGVIEEMTTGLNIDISTRQDILYSLKKNIEEFAKNNKINIYD